MSEIIQSVYTGFNGELTKGKFYKVVKLKNLYGFEHVFVINNFNKIENYPIRCFVNNTEKELKQYED